MHAITGPLLMTPSLVCTSLSTEPHLLLLRIDTDILYKPQLIYCTSPTVSLFHVFSGLDYTGGSARLLECTE